MKTEIADAAFFGAYAELMAPLPEAIVALTGRLMAVIAAYPGLSGKVMKGWKSVNFRHAKAGHVCAVFPHQDRVVLYFENGRLLEQGGGLLQGDDLKKGRYMRFEPGDRLPIDDIGIVLGEAIALFA